LPSDALDAVELAGGHDLGETTELDVVESGDVHWLDVEVIEVLGRCPAPGTC
jgi:hypothetical protein